MTETEADISGRESMQLGPLRESLPFLTRALRAHIRGENAVFFSDFDALQGEIVVICLIGENPGASQNDIASTLVFKKSAVTKLIKSLEDRGLVRREKVAADKRYNALTLTAAGRAKHKRILRRMAEIRETLLHVQGQRIVDFRSHAMLGQPVPQLVAALHADAVLVVDVSGAGGGARLHGPDLDGHGWRMRVVTGARHREKPCERCAAIASCET